MRGDPRGRISGANGRAGPLDGRRRAYTVVGQASRDGSVELVSLDLDIGRDWT